MPLGNLSQTHPSLKQLLVKNVAVGTMYSINTYYFIVATTHQHLTLKGCLKKKLLSTDNKCIDNALRTHKINLSLKYHLSKTTVWLPSQKLHNAQYLMISRGDI